MKDGKNLASPPSHYESSIIAGEEAVKPAMGNYCCLCGIPESPDFASATHCQWCGTLKGLRLPSGSQIHVWFTNGSVAGVVQTIIPQNRGGTWFLLNPQTGVEQEIDSTVWRVAVQELETNNETPSYALDVVSAFAASLGKEALCAFQQRLGHQRPVPPCIVLDEGGDASQTFLLSKIALSPLSPPPLILRPVQETDGAVLTRGNMKPPRGL